MLKISEKIKVKKLKELTEGEKAEIFTDAITTIGKFKGLAMADNEAIQIFDSMKYFIDSKFSFLRVYEVLIAFEKGMTGEYKQTFKFNADTLVFWLNEYHKETAIDKHRVHVHDSNTSIIDAPKNVTEENKWFALACLVRVQCDCGGKKCKEKGISLEAIVDGLKNGRNVITGNKYTEAECQKLARDSKSVLLTRSKRV